MVIVAEFGAEGNGREPPDSGGAARHMASIGTGAGDSFAGPFGRVIGAIQC